MFLKFAALAAVLAAAAPAAASDWYYVDSANDYANISFIDKDGIKTNADGTLTGSMYSVLAEEDDGAVAFLFTIEANCAAKKTRMTHAEMFDPKLVSSGRLETGGDWESNDPGTQGETIMNFICAKGANATKPSVGSAMPFEKGRAMLAEMRAGKK